MNLNKTIFALFCSLFFVACGGNGEPSGKPDGGSTDGQVVTNPCKDAASRCDDKVACTRDSCDEATGECRHQADHALCSAGTVCMPKEGCKSPPPCETNEDCPDIDGSPCMKEYCDAVSSACFWNPLDKDGDGHAPQICKDIGGDDCDDNNSSRHPGAEEWCGSDYDCDGETDDFSPGNAQTFCQDADGDGAGNPEVMKEACSVPEGYVDNADDCDDSDTNISQCIPPEICGGGGVPGVCGCPPRCADKCGGADGCGGECPDNCVLPQTCGGGGTQYICGCTPQCEENCGQPDRCGGNCPAQFTDSSSGLTWQNPSAEGQMNWQNAMDYCESLTSCGHSDWRLPTISELRSLIRGCPDTELGGDCGVTDSCLDNSCWNDSCQGCPMGEGPAEGCYWPNEMEGECVSYWVSGSSYWSSSSYADSPGDAWFVEFYYGYASNLDKADGNRVRCVRGGP